MRIQILPLPSVVVGDDVQEPFALVIDQWETDADASDATRTMWAMAWQQFREECGARALISTPETVEIVDRYAESASDAVAVREFERLDDFLLLNFDNEHGLYEDNDSAADVAIRLLRELLLRRDAVKAADQTGRLLSELTKPVEGEAP